MQQTMGAKSNGNGTGNPGLEGKLTPGSTYQGIEIIRPFDGTKIQYSLFDFDGTLSRERDGWPALMLKSATEAIRDALPWIEESEAQDAILTIIERTIGVPTYLQMEQLAAYIASVGGVPSSPREYKDSYNALLTSMVAKKHALLDHSDSRESALRSLRMPGARELLLALHEKMPGRIYLASGSDIGAITESVRKLGYADVFQDRIMAAGSLPSPSACAKEYVINRLVKEQGIGPGQLVCFGDGKPELSNAYGIGGICVGVLSDDHCEIPGRLTVGMKRERLIEAGAHVLVKDFTHYDRLIPLLYSKQR